MNERSRVSYVRRTYVHLSVTAVLLHLLHKTRIYCNLHNTTRTRHTINTGVDSIIIYYIIYRGWRKYTDINFDLYFSARTHNWGKFIVDILTTMAGHMPAVENIVKE